MKGRIFLKAMAYFRGAREVEMEDVRQVLPFVLHDKLVIDPDSPFFDAPGNEPLRIDRVAWLRRLFDLACAEYDRLNLDKDDPVAELEAEYAGEAGSVWDDLPPVRLSEAARPERTGLLGWVKRLWRKPE